MDIHHHFFTHFESYEMLQRLKSRYLGLAHGQLVFSFIKRFPYFHKMGNFDQMVMMCFRVWFHRIGTKGSALDATVATHCWIFFLATLCVTNCEVFEDTEV